MMAVFEELGTVDCSVNWDSVMYKMYFKISSRMLVYISFFSAMAMSSVADAAESERFSLGHDVLSSSESDRRSSAIGTLTGKCGTISNDAFKPFIGAGLAYSIDQELKGSNPATRVKSGLAYQVGFSYILNNKSSLDVKFDQLNIKADSHHQVNDTTPSSCSLGLKIKF
jgi:opacity protein-like surface antigen